MRTFRRYTARVRVVVAGFAVVPSLAVTVFLAAVTPSGAQTTPPKVGVVLSGGSAKGFAHIGVLRVLEEAGVLIDVVTGTSMGGLVGGLYAIGYTPDEIEQIARGQDWANLFADPAGPAFLTASGRTRSVPTVISFPLEGGRVQLPTGLVAGQQISRLLARLTWPALGINDFRQLPIPFAAIATDIESGEAVVLDRGSLPLALRASMSLPGVFRPVAMDDRLLVDGGIVRNLPSAEARALGADILICSDVSEPPLAAANLRSFVDVLLQTVTFQMEASTIEQRRLCDVMIKPDIEGLSSTGFDRAADWIARGTQAAEPMMAAVRTATATAGRRVARPAAAPTPPRQLDAIEIIGLSDEGRRFAASVANLPVPGTVTAEDLDAALERLYRTGAFDHVSYRIDEARPATLLVDASAREAGALGFGFRYDSRFKASLLFDATLHSVGRFGSTTHVAIRLGEQFELSGQHLFRAGVGSRWITGLTAAYVETPISIFAGDTQVAEAKIEVGRGSAFAGRRVGRRALASIGVNAEHARGGTRIAAVQAGEARTFYTPSGAVSLDTLDQPVFPHQGVRILARTEGAHRRIGSGGTFWINQVDVDAAIPITGRLTLQTRAMTGAAGGADLPFHYQFFLGGTVPSAIFPERQIAFPGLEAQERAGRAVHLLQAGLQFEPTEQLFVAVRVHAGNTADRWQLRFDDYRFGYEFSAGATTVIGPVELVASGQDGAPAFAVRLGHRF